MKKNINKNNFFLFFQIVDLTIMKVKYFGTLKSNFLLRTFKQQTKDKTEILKNSENK